MNELHTAIHPFRRQKSTLVFGWQTSSVPKPTNMAAIVPAALYHFSKVTSPILFCQPQIPSAGGVVTSHLHDRRLSQTMNCNPLATPKNSTRTIASFPVHVCGYNSHQPRNHCIFHSLYLLHLRTTRQRHLSPGILGSNAHKFLKAYCVRESPTPTSWATRLVICVHFSSSASQSSSGMTTIAISGKASTF